MDPCVILPPFAFPQSPSFLASHVERAASSIPPRLPPDTVRLAHGGCTTGGSRIPALLRSKFLAPPVFEDNSPTIERARFFSRKYGQWNRHTEHFVIF